MARRRPADLDGRTAARRVCLAVAGSGLLTTLGACASDTGAGEASPTAQEPTTSSSAPASPTGSGSPSAETEATPPATGRAKAGGRAVETGGSAFGEMLFDRSGQAIYLFEKETGPRAACYGPCAEAWPPVLTQGRPRALGNVRQGLLGTTERRDGSRQVTYAGHPLYFYAHEGKGEVLCHGVDQFGALWLVVRPDGRPAPH